MTVPRIFAPGAPGDSAAPAGGTAADHTRRCRGCRPVSIILSALCLVLGGLSPEGAGADDAALVLPSGMVAQPWDIVDEAPVYRVRYVAPALAEGMPDVDALIDDMGWLCAQRALPELVGAGAQPARIVVTLMAEPVDFGVMTPDVVQVFESYAIEDSRCIWEAF